MPDSGRSGVHDDLIRERDRYRAAIRYALDMMGVANDRDLGEGGVARRAYAHLWHEYHAIPAGIPSARPEDTDHA